MLIEALQIIATVPVLLDLLLCHSRAWLPREESRSFPTSSSGIPPRAPDTPAGMTEKFDRAGVRVTILCRTQIVGARIQKGKSRLVCIEARHEIPGSRAGG